jgi:hypothetical protein
VAAAEGVAQEEAADEAATSPYEDFTAPQGLPAPGGRLFSTTEQRPGFGAYCPTFLSSLGEDEFFRIVSAAV